MAEPDLLKACSGADVLLFVVPHQFIGKVCEQLKGHVKKGAIGVSLIKVRAGGAPPWQPGVTACAGLQRGARGVWEQKVGSGVLVAYKRGVGSLRGGLEVCSWSGKG